ncbi:hypothetical protein CBFG_03016 [Clostridiales bacterium 1_7_47FAA]|nr:hypothetical protein CBFG_03016 [Clostridiales bacterium 1_7_47FAA]
MFNPAPFLRVRVPAVMEQGKKSREHFPSDDYNVYVRRWTDEGAGKRGSGTD